MIVPDSIIRFKYTHLSRDIGKGINFDINHKRLDEVKKTYYKYMNVLKDCAMPQADFLPLLQMALCMKPPRNVEKDNRIALEWKSLCEYLDAKCNEYVQELGENAYSVFNAITDVASHPPQNRCVYRDRHSYQQLAGAWLTDFHTECLKTDF